MTVLLLACASDPEARRDPYPVDSATAPLDTSTGTTPPPDSGTPTTTGAPDTFEADFLWVPIVLAWAPDLGHVPQDVAVPVPPGPPTFTEVGLVTIT